MLHYIIFTLITAISQVLTKYVFYSENGSNIRGSFTGPN